MGNRFEATFEVRYKNCGFVVERGVGSTLQEAREDLIRRIEKNDLIFPQEKEQLIKQIKELGSEPL